MLNIRSLVSSALHQIGKQIPTLADRQMSGAAVSVYAIRLGGAGLGYVVQVVLAQFLGALNYGVFAMMWILTTVAAQLSAAGFNESSNRFLPGYLAQGDHAHAKGFVRLAKLLTLGVSVAVMVIGICALLLGRAWISQIYFWPAILALAIHNAGILGKLGAELIDNADTRTPSALRSMGLSRTQIALADLAPALSPKWLAYFFYRWETCIRESVVLGMLGIATLGYYVSDARSRDWYDEMLFFILLGTALVLLIEAFSTLSRAYIRKM